MNREKNSTKTALVRAGISYFFRETFRAHSRAEYKEIFSRGLNEDNTGVSGAFPWLYVRAFFALFVLFTVNILIMRLTENALYIPSMVFLGGITFTVPFIVLLYELYPKRDMSLFIIIAVLVGGGTLAGVFTQLCYILIPQQEKWLNAVVVGCVEEASKAVPAIFLILVLRKKDSYACYLIAAAVGAGFSIVEDMGYIFYYSEKYVFEYHSDIQAAVALFVDRGFSSFATHILWTGAIGWAASYIRHPWKSFSFFFIVASSVGLHIAWDLPLHGVWQALVIIACVIFAAALNITIVHKSRVRTLSREIDLNAVNEHIIKSAKEMGERLRFTNAANLTFAITCMLLSVFVLLFSALPIGVDYQQTKFDTPQDFIEFVQDGKELEVNLDRAYNPAMQDFAEYIEDGKVTSSVQRVVKGDIIYYYSYFHYENAARLDAVSVELPDCDSRIPLMRYEFSDEKVYAFEVRDDLIDYEYNSDGTVTAVLEAEEFRNFPWLIAICSTGVAVAAGCTVILISFIIKLWRVKEDE